MTSKPEPQEDATDPDTPLLEWVFGAIGLLLFIGALGVTLSNATGPREPPSISIHAEAFTISGGLFRVGYSALNSGDETAAGVHLVARLLSGEQVIEQQDAKIDLLPGGSSAEGGIFFKHDPSNLVTEIVPVSYQDP